jgi:hypothetical protein
VKLPNGIEIAREIELIRLTDAFFIGIERWNDLKFGHCHVFGSWSVKVRRDLRAAWDEVAQDEAPFFAASHMPHGGDAVKFAKFCRLMGCEFFRDVRCPDGQKHAVYVRWS